MTISRIIQSRVQYGDLTYAWNVTKTSGEELNISESITDSSNDLELTGTLDVSAMVALLMYSDQDVTIETNDGTTPADTITLTAGQPLIWHSSSGFTNPLGTDVTSFFVTNASGSAANLVIKGLQDPTP